MIPDVIVTSFGYRHGDQPPADLVMDLRRTLRDPLHTELRTLTGLDELVQGHVLGTPGAIATIRALVAATEAWRSLTAGTVRVGVGCGGGRHRSVAVAERVGHLLASLGMTVRVDHRDLHLPVLETQEAAS